MLWVCTVISGGVPLQQNVLPVEAFLTVLCIATTELYFHLYVGRLYPKSWISASACNSRLLTLLLKHYK